MRVIFSILCFLSYIGIYLVLKDNFAFLVLLASFIGLSLFSALIRITKGRFLEELITGLLALGASTLLTLAMIVAYPQLLGTRIFPTIAMVFMVMPITFIAHYSYSAFKVIMIGDQFKPIRLAMHSLVSALFSTLMIIAVILVAINVFTSSKITMSEKSYDSTVSTIDKISISGQEVVLWELENFKQDIITNEESSRRRFMAVATKICITDACLNAAGQRTVEEMNSSINARILEGTVNRVTPYIEHDLAPYLPQLKPEIEKIQVRTESNFNHDMSYAEMSEFFDTMTAKIGLDKKFNQDSLFSTSMASIVMHTEAFRALMETAYNMLELQEVQMKSPYLLQEMYKNKYVEETAKSKVMRYMIIQGLSNITAAVSQEN